MWLSCSPEVGGAETFLPCDLGRSTQTSREMFACSDKRKLELCLLLMVVLSVCDGVTKVTEGQVGSDGGLGGPGGQ